MSYSSETFTQGKSKANSLLAKSFLAMFIALLFTTAVALGLGLLFTYLIGNASDTTEQISIINLMNGLMIGSGVAIIVLTFINALVFLKGKHSLVVPFAIYSLVMGVFLSSFVTLIKWDVLVTAFGVASLTFCFMGIIGTFTKKNLSGFLLVAIGLLFGSSLLLFSILITTLITGRAPEPLVWIIEFATLIAMLIITAVDFNNIKHMSESGVEDKNIVIQSAMMLYNDFIYIFIRLIYIIALSRR